MQGGGLIKGQSIGNWLNNAGTSPDNQTQTTGAVGIGLSPWVGVQESWTHIRWCPPLPGPDQAGLILTLKDCNGNGTPALPNPNKFHTLPTDWQQFSSEPQTLQSYAFTSFLPLGTMPYGTPPTPTNYIAGVNSGREPLFWARTELTGTPPNGNTGFETQFIIMPNGHTGINISAPRAALDVRTWGLNTPTAIFGMHAVRGNITINNPAPGVDYKYSRHLAIIPFLGEQGYNDICQKGDMGLIFTDGMGANGENVDGTFIIAPWSANPDAGGLRMDKNGHIEMRGDLRCTKVVVNAKWWPDFVFEENYNLLPLTELSNYIQIHKHLPEMPSDKFIIEEGQDIGELQKLQQMKIEELTLYLIQLYEQNEMLKTKIEALSNEK